MNIDEIINRLVEPKREDYLDYLRALNPTLIHFFNFFTHNPNQSQEWFAELSENFFIKIRGRNSTPKHCKQLILSGAINLILRKKQGDILKRCNELIYEEVLLQPLPKRIFSPRYIPNTEDLERFRTQQLSTPMCLILDLIFQEKLKIKETAKILKLSENVFEPFLFTVFHRLTGEIEIECTNKESELELFSRILQSNDGSQIKNDFTKRLISIKNFLSIDIRNRLDQVILIKLCNKYFPVTENEEKPEAIAISSKSSSVIDQIKKRNRAMQLEEAAKQFSKEELTVGSEIEMHNPPRTINTELFYYAKYALGILTIFIGMVFYQTIFNQNKIPNLITVDNTKSTSITDFQNTMNQTIGTLSTLENEVTVAKMQWINQKNNPATLLLKPDIDIQISENTKLQIRSNKELFLKFGSLKVFTKNSELRIDSNDGSVFIGAKDKTTSSAHIAKTNRNYSIAGNTSGKVIVKEIVSEELINLNIGQQIIFGNHISKNVSSYNSAYFQPRLESSQINRRQLRILAPKFINNSLSKAELKDVLISLEKAIKKPSVQQKDFSQKL